jgi:gliding motility-associated-like protein
MHLLRYTSLSCLILLTLLARGQQVSITSGSATSCAGVIEDSGGPNAEYGNNESHTFVICPDVPGNVIYLTWFVFNLSTQGPGADNLTIYDGNSTAANSLGTYGGTSLQNLIVSGSVFNTSGCLTLVFQSNGAGTGDFAAGFQCTIPCQYPTAVATMPEVAPALICQGESVTFNGSGSTAQAGNTLAQYVWDFADGTIDSTSGPIASHTFTEPGERVVQLYVFDDNGCRNLNLVDLQILVSTTPDFSATSPSTETCFGETVVLVGQAAPVTWTGIPDANFGGGIFLPDDVGLPFTSTLTFEQFNSGQTVTSISDILSVCVEMEHSFMGDLVLQIICPNGQTSILHQQGGGGTYLGAPNDFDNNTNPIFGECWEYCWSPTATNGTWVTNAQAGNTTQAGTPPNNSLNPGTYQSVQPLSNLIGCPLNGDWTYQSTDLWGADNGFICSWSINFNPAIIPDVTQFTPSWGSGADSSAWSGGTTPTSISANGDTIVFTATAPGTYPFNYQVTDNHGCTYDTTITVIIQDPFIVNAGPDAVICNDPVQLEATVVGAATSCTWTLEMNDSFGDGWNGASMTVNNNGVTTNHTCQGSQTIATFTVQAGTTVTLTYSPGNWESEVDYRWIDDQGNVVFEAGPNPPTGQVWTGTATCNASQGMVWSWSPTTGLSDPTIADPTAVVTSNTAYVVTASIAGSPSCFATDTVVVSLDPALDPGTDTLIVVCATPPSFDLIDMLGGTPQPGGVWTDANGNLVATNFDPMVDAAGIYTYTVTTPAGCIGTADLEIQILPAEDPLCCGIVDAGPDSTICVLTYGLNASIGNTGVGVWSGPPGYVFDDPSDPQANVTAPGSGAAMLYWTENDGITCFLQDSLTIVFTQPLAATISVTDAICFQACDGTASVAMTGGNGAFNYVWSNAGAGDTTFVGGICTGDYSLTVTDENGCTTSANYTVNEPPLLEIDGVTFVEPWCFGGCDGSITIVDPQAVEYSFDAGATFSTQATLPEVCTGTYDLAIRSAAGCIGVGQVFVTEPLEVIAQFSHGPIPANVDDPRIFFFNESENSVAWQWDIAGLRSTNEQNPAFVFDNREPGFYDVCLVASDAHGCTDTICHLVTIEDVLFTYVANTFTPNADGTNDVWGMSSNIPDMKEFSMEVYDRWGQIVFESNDPYKMWNGTFKNGGGEPLKDGVYAYRIRFRLITTGGVRELTGHVSLLK